MEKLQTLNATLLADLLLSQSKEEALAAVKMMGKKQLEEVYCGFQDFMEGKKTLRKPE